jgi:hypothetical protein
LVTLEETSCFQQLWNDKKKDSNQFNVSIERILVMRVFIAPSILSADFARLGQEGKRMMVSLL